MYYENDGLDGYYSFYFSEEGLEFRKNHQEFYHYTYPYVKINGESKLYTHMVKTRKELGTYCNDYVFVGRAKMNEVILKDRPDYF